MDRILTITGIVLYALASVAAVASFARPAGQGSRRVVALLWAGALSLLALLVMHGIRTRFIPVFSRFDALACYAFAVTVAYLALSAPRRRPGVAALVAPYLTLMLALGAWSAGPGAPVSPSMHSLWLALHICTAFTAYALFSLAGLLAVAYLVQDHNLKHKRLGPVFHRLPALETLDELMSRQVGFAFVMLTISIVLGFVVAQFSGAGGQVWLTDPKVVATAGTWALYAVLVHMRASAGRHGKGVALVTILGFCCVLFAFIGVHTIAHSVHDFMLITVPVD